MTVDVRSEGVFFLDKPTIQDLKNCSLFWETIIVFEGYLSEVVDDPSLVDISKILFENGVLKIMHTPEGLKQALWDKIYHTLDIELREMLYKNPQKFIKEPERPINFDSIIKESSERDNNDKILQKLIDDIVKLNIYKEWFEPAIERAEMYGLSEDIKKEFFSEIKNIADMQYEHTHKKGGYGFNWRNKILLEQVLVSSSLFVDYAWLPYYSYKLGDYSVKDARKYLMGLKHIMPFINKESLRDFSIEDIFQIRKNKRWNKAMNKLSVLCNVVKNHYYSDEFKEDIKHLVIYEMLDTLDQEEVTWDDVKEDMKRESMYVGVGFIPIIGSAISGIAGMSDPLLNYISKQQSQKTLPFFLNDIRKMNK